MKYIRRRICPPASCSLSFSIYGRYWISCILPVLLWLVLPASASAQTRFKLSEWKTSVTKHFLIHHHEHVSPQFVELTASRAEDTFARYAPALKLKWDERNSIFIYPDRSYFLLNAIYGQGEIYLDAGGEVDLFKHRVIAAADVSLTEYGRNLDSLVLRALIYRKLMGTTGNVMRLVKSAVYAEWLLLGTCEYLSAPDDPEREGFFNHLYVSERLFRLTELYNFDYLSGPAQRAALAQSAEMVKWIISRWGEDKVWEMLSLYPEYWSNDELLKKTLGMTQTGFLEEFRKSVTLRSKGPAFPSETEEVTQNHRFCGDAMFPVVHYASDRVFFTGEYDGGRNVFELLPGKKYKRIFREVPFRTIEAVIHPLKIRGNTGTMTGVRYLEPVDITLRFSSSGDLLSFDSSKHRPYVPCMINDICVLTAMPAAGEKESAVCEDSAGQFIAEIKGGTITELARCRGMTAGLTFSPKTGRTYFAASLGTDQRFRLYSIGSEGDLKLELDSPYGILYPAAARERLYFCSPGLYSYEIRSIPYASLMGEPVERPALKDIGLREFRTGLIQKSEKGINPVTSDVVIPGILWNSSDEFGVNEFWLSFAFSTGLVSTSGFEENSSGAFIAPLLKTAYMHKFPLLDFRLSAEFQFGDLLDVRDYEERNKLTTDAVFDYTVNSRLLISAGLQLETSERADAVSDEYRIHKAVGPVAEITFNGMIERENLPRRGGGFLLKTARFYESMGSTSTYTSAELDADLFLPVTRDSVLQFHGGAYAAYGEDAAEFDMGRTGGVLSQPLFEHSGKYLAVARIMYRFPLMRDINATASGIILLKQIRMGLFADMGVISNTSFTDWKPDEPFLTARKSVGALMIFEMYPVEGFQLPLILSFAYDPDNETLKAALEFEFYF